MKTNNTIKYKVPLDVWYDLLRILLRERIKFKTISVHPVDNIQTIEVDFTGVKHQEAKQNIETILEDYREYMQDIVGDAILNLTDDNEDDN